VRIALAEKGVDYDPVVIDLQSRPAWIYELNASGRVPILRDGDFVLPESAVINELLEERYPDPPLLPERPEERAAARLLVFRHDDFKVPYYALRRGEPGAETDFAAELDKLDSILERQPYLTGTDFGLADIAYVPWVIRARDTLDVLLAAHPHLEEWLARVSERPSVAAEIGVVAAL
jgi:glutathione S-transferase